MKQTALSELGEFGLIDRLKEKLSAGNASTVRGIGDDCAVLAKNEHEYTLVSTDLLMEGIHFDLMYSPLKHLGYKAAMVNISDIYAMNGTPEHLTVSIAVSAKFTVEALEQLYEGINLACSRCGVDVVGGDTSSSVTGLAISITAIGSVAKTAVAYRSGAQENDLICVSGDLGASYMGLQILQREKHVFAQAGAQPKLAGYEYVLQRHLKPEARKDIIEQLKIAGITPTSMIDVSDGLSSELLHLCTQSKMGCKVYEEKIPISADVATVCKEFDITPLIAALHGGEDYELLFTVPLKDYNVVKKIPSVHAIGSVSARSAGAVLVSKAGEQIALQAQGWKQF
ncbi:MAG: thiamine-phosphate kinase [Bacteroidales bacterium]|jgi:thiamine-monophosphate kinase|nr:thiamine-phosphate kinase [Bacteroidales bacterium]